MKYPHYTNVAATMLDTTPESLHEDLVYQLHRVNALCERTNGSLISRQTVALVITQWERERYLSSQS